MSSKTRNRSYDVVLIGNYTKDTIVTKAGTRHVDGGGFNYAAHAVATMGLRAAAITKLAEEDRRVVERLESIGVHVYAEYTESSTIMRLEYPTENVDERVLTVAATAGAITRAQVAGLNFRAALISPSIRGEVPVEVLRELRKQDCLVGADVQGYIRVIGPGGRLEHAPWPEKSEVLALIDILKTDAVEAEFLTGTPDIEVAAKLLAEHGPREIVLTHRDGLLVYAAGQFHHAAFLPKSLRGRSGRGDTCAGSYVGKRLSASPAESTRWAAALTSIKMEAEGPLRRPLEDVQALLAAAYS